MDELRMRLLHEIIRVYGPNQGQSIGAVIIPAFFPKTLSALVVPELPLPCSRISI